MRVGSREMCLLAGLIALFACGSAFSQIQPAPISTDPNDIYYYNGPIRVDIRLLMDELEIVPERGRRVSTAGLQSLVPQADLELRKGKSVGVRFATSAANRKDLAARALSISGSGYEVAALFHSASYTSKDNAPRQVLLRRFSLKPAEGTELQTLLQLYGLSLLEEVSYAPNTYIVQSIDQDIFAGVEAANRMVESGDAEFATPIVLREQSLRFIPNDQLLPLQWHLINTGQVSGSVAGYDANVVDAWDTATGTGINIAISDTGVQVTHADLVGNARTDIDIDIVDEDDDPTPITSHGSSVAGIAAASGNNSVGVAGSAFNAGIVGIRLLQGFTTDQDEADAMNHQVVDANPNNWVHINNNSWGPSDDGQTLETFGPLTEAAIVNGVTNGRGGLGTIYVWAGGNGRAAGDNVNYDGYASSRYTIAVGASGADGIVPSYSEQGASLLVNAPSSYISSASGGFVGTATTNITGYTSSFSGTSSAAPLASGVVALMLEANNSLGWRDVQHILLDTAVRNVPAGLGWITNGSERKFNPNYGYGRIDASAAVARSIGWAPVPAEATPLLVIETNDLPIPDNNTTGVSQIRSLSNVPDGFFTEYVELTVNVTHPRRGDLRFELFSPHGTRSVLSKPHNDNASNYSNWKFSSVAHWGEDPQGSWTVTVSDRSAGNIGTLTNWRLDVYGFIADTSEVWVNPVSTAPGHGTENYPYSSLQPALNLVDSGGTIHMKPGSLMDPITISKPVTLEAANGTVSLGG